MIVIIRQHCCLLDDAWSTILRPCQQYLVISGQWADDNERFTLFTVEKDSNSRLLDQYANA